MFTFRPVRLHLTVRMLTQECGDQLGSIPWLSAAVLVRSDVRPGVSGATVDVSARAEAPACAVDEQGRRGSGAAGGVEVHPADSIGATARNSLQYDVRDCRAGNAADVVRDLDEADDVVGEERSPAPL